MYKLAPAIHKTCFFFDEIRMYFLAHYASGKLDVKNQLKNVIFDSLFFNNIYDNFFTYYLQYEYSILT